MNGWSIGYYELIARLVRSCFGVIHPPTHFNLATIVSVNLLQYVTVLNTKIELTFDTYLRDKLYEKRDNTSYIYHTSFSF